MFYWYDEKKWVDRSASASCILNAINGLAAAQDGVKARQDGVAARQDDVEARNETFVWQTGANDGLAIPVTKIECFHQRLGFYRSPCWLFKLTCAHGPGVFANHEVMAGAYAEPLAFAVLRAVTDGELGADINPEAFDDILRVSWNAVAIHTFNDPTHGALDLSGPAEAGLDSAKARDYLRFFTAFIRADEGPFLCIERFAELGLDSTQQSGLAPLLQLLLANGHRPGIDDFSTTAAAALPPRFDDKLIEQTAPPDGDAKPGIAYFSARMLYGDTCFDTQLTVDAQGNVGMDNDSPVAQNGLWALHETAVARNGASLLLRRKPRHALAADALKTQLRDESAPGGAVLVANRRVSGRCDLSGLASGALIEFRNVEFLGDVRFDEARLEHSLHFFQCQFARNLTLRGARLKASLVLQGCTIHGLRDDPSATHALDLNGLRAEGDVRLSACQITGPLGCHGLRVDEDLILEDVQHLRRDAVKSSNGGVLLPADATDAASLDLTFARIGGALRVAPATTDRLGKQALQQTQLCGNLLTGHAHLREGYLQCRLTGHLDAQNLECTGDLHLQGKADIPPVGSDLDVGSDLSFRGARLKTLTITGMAVGGDLNLTAVAAAGMVSLTNNRIGGGAHLSGGQFDSDVDLERTQIDGAIASAAGGRRRDDRWHATQHRARRRYLDQRGQSGQSCLHKPAGLRPRNRHR